MSFWSEDGLTLIELLLAVVIIGIIVVPVTNFNLVIWNNFANHENQVSIQQQARDIIYHLERNVMRAKKLEIIDVDSDGRPELLLEFSEDLISDQNRRFVMYDFRSDGVFARAIKRSSHVGADWTVSEFWGNRSPISEEVVYPDGVNQLFDSNNCGSLLLVNFILINDNLDYPVSYEIQPRLGIVKDYF